MILADETFDGTWPDARRFFSGNGFRQHCVDPRDVRLVIQDWGGSIGSQFADRQPERVKRRGANHVTVRKHRTSAGP